MLWYPQKVYQALTSQSKGNDLQGCSPESGVNDGIYKYLEKLFPFPRFPSSTGQKGEKMVEEGRKRALEA